MELICLDLEASGLGPSSYPIEVAWKNALDNTSDNFLINPDSVEGWEYWDDFAEEIHGIERSKLTVKGVTAEEACTRLNQQLEGKQVLSDAWEFDHFWLTRLYQAADMEMTFTLVGLEAVLGGEELVQYRFVSKSQLRRHRAMNDVDHILQAICAVKAID